MTTEIHGFPSQCGVLLVGLSIGLSLGILRMVVDTIESGLVVTSEDQGDNNDKWKTFVSGGTDENDIANRSASIA